MHRILLLLALICFANKTSFGQSFTVIPRSFDTLWMNVDLSDNFISFPLKSNLSNNSQDTLNVKWFRVKSQDCPAEWNILISDFNISYLPHVDTSVIPLIMYPGDTLKHFSLEVAPRQTPGCCEVEVFFTDYDNLSVRYDTAAYKLTINNSDCDITYLPEVLNTSNFAIYPNPVINSFSLTANKEFETIEIYSLRGALVETSKSLPGVKYDIDHLQPGVYFLRIPEYDFKSILMKL